MNWPIGDGQDFKGAHVFERNERISAEIFIPLDELESSGLLSNVGVETLKASSQLLDEVGIVFDHQNVLQEKQTLVFFGSALTNFGVRLFLEEFVKFAPLPPPYLSDAGIISPEMLDFSGFIFKIQANMNPSTATA